MPRLQLSSSYSSAPYYSSFPPDCSSMSISGIQGQLLEVTVIGCNKLRDTEWISRQDPYVCLEYANTKHRTRTCTDGGKHPTFQEKFVFPLVEGLREINVMVWNSNTVTSDDFIGGGKVQLQKVLTQGYDDSAWPLQTKHGRRYAGEVRLIMHYSKTNKPTSSYAPSAPPYGAPHASQAHLYSAPPPAGHYAPPAPGPYPPVPAGYPAPSPYPSYSPNSAGYPPSPYFPNPSAYGHTPSSYPPAPYPPTSTYPPPPQSSPYPPNPFPGLYPPSPY
ncbi:actin cytoskeleton-regulatory complex protein PAN1-like [Pyrus ussuriensis x Pyrus communis]|uniref:Actin cytoskeleton-regulatory complex protein PAN1-like n=1 Tax=Pyrus ussuriensis x Pyrus communis TaxID=2448454 RepID=A0A5N5I0Z3_9ROSA|nr:actin cytoskeleton-regulatory complex protein PAN1-like [Pyrus ussuriensis x Pyrus communis]